MKDLLAVGPPVYFVVKSGPNYSDSHVQDAMCGGQRCRSDSVFTQLYAATKSPKEWVIRCPRKRSTRSLINPLLLPSSYLANAPSSWLDDYFDWTLVTGCCKYFAINDSYCPHNCEYIISRPLVLHRRAHMWEMRLFAHSAKKASLPPIYLLPLAMLLFAPQSSTIFPPPFRWQCMY